MDTRKKLREAKFFLDHITQSREEREDLEFYVSAFLNAWRSVLDIMLYDFAEKFSLPFTRKEQITRRDFEVAAKASSNHTASKFIEWWEKKWNLLSKDPLWRLRNVSFHREYPSLSPKTPEREQFTTIYLSASGGTSGTMNVIAYQGSPYTRVHPHVSGLPFHKLPWHFDEVASDGKEVCQTGYEKMMKIVEEAEKEFNVSL